MKAGWPVVGTAACLGDTINCHCHDISLRHTYTQKHTCIHIYKPIHMPRPQLKLHLHHGAAIVGIRCSNSITCHKMCCTKCLFKCSALCLLHMNFVIRQIPTKIQHININTHTHIYNYLMHSWYVRNCQASFLGTCSRSSYVTACIHACMLCVCTEVLFDIAPTHIQVQRIKLTTRLGDIIL